MSRTSLTRFLIQEQHAGRINADLRQLIAVVARACTSISIAVSKGALGGVLGDAGTGNVQGEAQKKLDVISNEILLEANAWGGHLAACAQCLAHMMRAAAVDGRARPPVLRCPLCVAPVTDVLRAYVA